MDAARRQVLTTGAALALAASTLAQPPASPRDGLSIDALAATVWVEEFDVSPDGSLVAFKSAKAGTYDIWVVPVRGGEPRQVTSLPGREMAPRFSPDGHTIVFEADAGGTDVRDLYLVPAAGGDVTRLTDHPLDDRDPSWSPDGSRIYFTTQMFWERSLAAIDLASGAIERLGPPGGTLSPDGRHVVFTANRKPRDDDQSNSDVYVMPVRGSQDDERLLTPDTLDALDRSPAWSPDGSRIAFISDRNGWNNVGVIDVATGETTMLLTEPIEHGEPRWSPDGRWISFTKNLDYHYQIFRVAADGSSVEQLTEMPGVNGGSRATGQTRGRHAWHPGGREIFFTHSDPGATGDVWSVSIEGLEPRRITDHRGDGLPGAEAFVWPELMEYRSFDGLEVAALVYKPHGASVGDRLPGLFFFRANSNGQHPVQWHPYVQYFVSRGYVVLAPNFRGSTGRGKVYRQAVHRHGGDHDLRDAFLGMDLLAAEGLGRPRPRRRLRRLDRGLLHDDGGDQGPRALQGGRRMVRLDRSRDAVELCGDGGVEPLSHRRHAARQPRRLLPPVDHLPRGTDPDAFAVPLRAGRPRGEVPSRSSSTACRRPCTATGSTGSSMRASRTAGITGVPTRWRARSRSCRACSTSTCWGSPGTWTTTCTRSPAASVRGSSSAATRPSTSGTRSRTPASASGHHVQWARCDGRDSRSC